ncbi:hypothetical protein [Bacillus marasmi]|uniref:hypothetical protein n=1 Tax=Bacillus marasmi TaxID=1926279 RepID=UPI0011C71409|nr:hypothetical protein [Bacillus marasmi]
MDRPSKQERKALFLEELHLLLEEDYINGRQFNDIARAHHKYYRDLQDDHELNHAVKKAAMQAPWPTSSSTVTAKPKRTILAKPQREIKKLNPEEIRERNITWSLNLGVILLLIGGLFVATSNWASMPNWMKSGSIGLVSFLFFGISYFSKRVLKIEKTGLAFIVLGSLFLPIFLLSIGWFKLLGDYFSFNGEGRYIFGLISCILLIPIYIAIARKLSSRLFVWFSYLTTTTGAAFLIAALHLRQDWFYFGFMLYNVGTVLVFHRLKKQESLKLFTNELVAFAQIQLILSSLLTLIFYENGLVNGLNLLLTAAVYLAMVFVSGKKEYHFIFSTMIVYGAYQVIYHSMLNSFAEVLFVLVGIGFLALPKFLDEQDHWRKVFQLTSAVVSGAAFIYISLEAFYVNMMFDTPSWAIFFAYLLLAGQFVYLANNLRLLLFHYLSPIFLAASLFELIHFANLIIKLNDLSLPIFLIGFTLFCTIGFLMKQTYLLIIKQSSRDIGMAIMMVGILMTLYHEKWLQLGIINLLISACFYLSEKIDQRKILKLAIPWLLPLSLAFSGLAFAEQIRVSSDYYYVNFGIVMNAIVASASSFLAYYVWTRIKQIELANNSFLVGQGFYSLAILFALTFNIDEVWVRPAVLVVGIAVYIAFYLVLRYKYLPYIIGILSLITYFVVLQSLYLQVQVPTTMIYLENTLGGVLILIAGLVVSRKSSAIASGFVWVGHLYLPGALLFSFFIFTENTVWNFLLSGAVYFTSAYLVQTEWQIKAFLYSGFTSIYLWFVTGMLSLKLELEPQYSFLFTSLTIFVYWLLASPNFKNRAKYYLVPFSMLGIAAFIGTYPYSLTLYAVTVIYAFGLIAYLTVIKWNIMTLIPLLLFFSATMKYLKIATFLNEYKITLVCGIGLVLLFVGKLVYQQFYEEDDKGSVKQIDGYTITALLFLGSGYLYKTELIFTAFIPGVLLSFGLWLQIARIPERFRIWVKLVSGIYLIEPYYSTLAMLNIPELFERELQMLPLVVVSIYLQHCLNGKYKLITSKIHWSILILVSLFLIQDGLESSTIYDALILGTLSLVSMLVGMFLKVKSYFIVGSGVLLLNVLLQTRPFWGNMPWWAYLLIAGSILISVASFNEWNKQKVAKGEITGITKLKEKLVAWYKKWD